MASDLARRCRDYAASHEESVVGCELLREAARRVEELEEALKGAEAWLDRWAVHVGSCAGGGKCSCGLTAISFEARSVLSEEEKGS